MRNIIPSMSLSLETSTDDLIEFSESPRLEPFNPRTITYLRVKYGQLLLVFQHLCDETTLDENYPLTNIEILCTSLVQKQIASPDESEGYWSFLPDGIPGETDARVEFVMDPTYLAISILTKFMITYPEITKRILGYEVALKRGYKFATQRELRGQLRN